MWHRLLQAESWPDRTARFSFLKQGLKRRMIFHNLTVRIQDSWRDIHERNH